jgi:hypothetical protein
MDHLSLCRGCVRGSWRGGFFSGDFERYVKRALEMERLSLRRGCVRGSWRGGLLFWGLREICKEGSGDGASFCT